MTYRLERRQVVSASLGEVFAFFCDPLNLGEPEARTCIQVAYVPVSD